jgi:DNA-binding transcriptional MocR family regulator
MGTGDLSTGEAEALSRVDQIVTTLTGRIERGMLRPGERLPSIRAASTMFGVSKNTVVDAYDKLVARGHIEARHGSGFYICGPRPRPAERRTPDVVEAVDSVWLLREQLEQHYAVRVGDGRPPAAWMEGSEVGRHLKPLSRPGARTFPESYGSPLGFSYGFRLIRPGCLAWATSGSLCRV